MVVLSINIKCDLENLTNFGPADDSFTYYFKIRCSCGEISNKESSVTRGEEYEIKGSRGTANLVQKCQLCGKSGSISILDGGSRKFTAEDSEGGKFAPLVRLDCRGIEPTELVPKDGWEAEGAESGTKFSDIDLSEGDYSEYDEKAQASVGIYNFTSKVVVSK